MIQRIQQSNLTKILSVYLILNILAEIIAPMRALALTGGPAQPEYGSFTPIGTSDMVDLSSGDMNYNIPLMDVGGYPINIGYNSGVGMDDEASWVGLGWNLSVGQINRNVRGLPDDFKGDEMVYENHMKPNVTVGATFKFTPNVFGMEIPTDWGGFNESAGDVSVGLSAIYNNYNGFTLKPSFGIQQDLGKSASIGFNVESGPDGMSISPNLSLHGHDGTKNKRLKNMGANVGISMNSRQGLTSTTLSMSRRSQYETKIDGKDVTVKTSGGIGSSIGFTDNLYTPDKRNAMQNKLFTVNAAIGSEFFGGEGQGQVTAFGMIQALAPEEKEKRVGGFGYQHTDMAGKSQILDFNREKDGAFSVNSTNLPVTNYTYDIYSVQGQGVSGMYRPYRNQVGYVYDAEVTDVSGSATLGLEFGVGNAAHAGADFEASITDSRSGLWDDNNYILAYLKEHYNYNPKYEKVHFKNVGDLSVDDEFQLFNQVARYQPARVSFVGNKFNRKAVSELKYKYNAEGNEQLIGVSNAVKRTKRQGRNQAIYNLTVGEVNSGVGYGPCVKRSASDPEYVLPSAAKTHHTAEVQVIRNDGARYVYGLPAYNLVKREASFSVYNTSANCNTGLVEYQAGVDNTSDNKIHNQNFNRVTTPAYAHTYLLTSILSSDYQDRTNDGPTEDDLGNYTRFTYEKAATPVYRWRVPYEYATYNAGLNTDPKDDQGNYVYGEKEQVYIRKIETKTHVAIFDIEARKDAKGVAGENGGLDNSQNTYKLTRIRLYSKAEYDDDPVNAVPIKQVHFVYSYSLCPGVPNNNNNQTLTSSELSNKGGKLTLKKIYFTYRDSKMGKYTGYKFRYNEFNDGKDELSHPDQIGSFVINSAENPAYNIKGYDSWGNYKPNSGTCANTSDVTAAEYPFTEQTKSVQDVRSAVWSMKAVDLPSGGRISIEYESDDYAYVQDRKPLRMYKVVGAGRDDSPTSYVPDNFSDVLFSSNLENLPNHYLYVKLPDGTAASSDQAAIKNQFFNNLEGGRVYFRFYVNMTRAGGTATSEPDLNNAHFDYVTGYLELDSRTTEIFTNGSNSYLSVPIKTVNREGGVDPTKQVNPITKAAWQFGRKYLSQHVYSNQPNGDTEDVEALVTELLSSNVLTNLKEIFTGPNVTLENKFIGRTFINKKSWIRLNEPTGFKYGGGTRVKEIRSTDVWEEMNPGQSDYQTMSYGQRYEYVLADSDNDPETNKSSGVATYEPVGNKENPFVQPVFATTKHLLAPDEENYVEMPFGESFFPNPQVTYSRVRVRNLTLGEAPGEGMQVKQLHRTGSVVSEFYTSKDYPTLVDQTIFEAKEDDQQALANILKLNVRKHFTASQGYVIHLNDMNGKQKSVRVYAEGQAAAISGVDYRYDSNTASGPTDTERNKGLLDNTVKVIYPNGSVGMKTIGVEYDVVHDFRANESITMVPGINANLATFFVGIIPGIVPVPLPDFSRTEDKFRSVSTTKVINTFGILKETVVYDAGAAVYTRNLAWDAVTGEVLLTETVDEYNDNYYSFNYPAHWYYKGMGQASRNLGITGTLQATGSSYNMQGIGSSPVSNFLIQGDEIVYGTPDVNGIRPHAWVSQLQGTTFKLIDQSGTAVTGASGDFEVIRSGHRNLQSAGIMNVTLMRNPLKTALGADVTNLGTSFMNGASWDDWRIINAGAVNYSDNWPAGCECGITGTNPYVRNERGNWRVTASYTYLTGRNKQAELTPRQQGFLNDFSPFYKLSQSGNWYRDTDGWTFVSQITQYSPYGFGIESRDALNRYSGTQYGYNNRFPMAVGANTRYSEIGFDGMEDHGFTGCTTNTHFSFRGLTNAILDSEEAHTGQNSLKVEGGNTVTLNKKTSCPVEP